MIPSALPVIPARLVRRLCGVALLMTLAAPASAATIYPIDRAQILAGSRFDFRVDFAKPVAVTEIYVTINGRTYTRRFYGERSFVQGELDNPDPEKANKFSSLRIANETLEPGDYKIVVEGPDGDTATAN